MEKSRLFLAASLALIVFCLTFFSWGLPQLVSKTTVQRVSAPPHDLVVSELLTDGKVIEVSSSGVHFLRYQSRLTVEVKVANGGREAEGPVVVGLTLVDEGFKKVIFQKNRFLSSLSPGQEKTVIFKDVPSNQGSTNRLQAFVYPVLGEELLENNQQVTRYIMKVPPY